jgi:integrase
MKYVRCVSSIKTIEGVLCFEITEGKTKSAARIVPVHSKLIPLVKSLLKTTHSGFLFYHASITDRADGKRSTWHTQQFTRAKRKALGELAAERKVFHSLRHAFVQQLDRAQVPEDRIALLVGHERGSTESKTYSKCSSTSRTVALRGVCEPSNSHLNLWMFEPSIWATPSLQLPAIRCNDPLIC